MTAAQQHKDTQKWRKEESLQHEQPKKKLKN